MIKKSNQSATGTSFHDDEFMATYEVLVKAFGESKGPSGDEKVSAEWVLELEDGSLFTIYDYKQYRSARANPKTPWYWHIGAKRPEVSKRALAAVLEELKRWE